MTKNFIITSHTSGNNSVIKKAYLFGLVKSIKHYWPDSFVIVASQSDVEIDVHEFADYVLIDKSTVNVPHGAGELQLVKMSLNILEHLGKAENYKMTYDFVINDDNYHVFDEWQSHGKEFVSCWWKNSCLGIGSWLWYGTVSIQKDILDFPVLDHYLEKKILDSVESKGLMTKCHLYNGPDEMLAHTWDTCGDQIISGGADLKRDYGKVIAVVQTKSRDESILSLVLHSITNQTMLPAFLLIVDSNSSMVDMRDIPVYNKILTNCELRNIHWGVVFSDTVKSVMPNDFMWCWLVDENVIPDYNELEDLYKATVLDATVTSVKIPKKSKLYKLT